MKPRRVQSNDGRAQSAQKKISLQGGYTMYSQSGQKFHLPNTKMASQRTILEIENRAKFQTLQPINTDTQTNDRRQCQTIDYSNGNAALVLTNNLNYRVAQPYSATVDVNAKLWDLSKKTTKGLKRVSSAYPQKQSEVELKQTEIDFDFQSDDVDFSCSGKKPFEFLSSLGGKMMSNNLEEVSTQKDIHISQQPSIQIQKRPQTVSTIGKIDFTMIMNESKQKQRDLKSAVMTNPVSRPPVSKRPMTSALARPGSQQLEQNKKLNKDRIQSATFDIRKQQSQVDQEIDQIHELPQQFERPKSNWSQSRPISAKTASPQQFFQKYTKYTNFNALDQPYEELFDRNERTVAATFARFGDLGYYSPIQRIGAYMQFSAKLKQDHLLKIIDLQKTMSSVEKSENEIPIQLAIINEINPHENRDKTGINSGADDTYTREPISLSLFPEYFEDHDEKVTQMELAMQKFQEIMDEMGGNYDPAMLGKSYYLYIEQEQWTDNIRKEMDSSIQRYEHYLNSDQIRNNEIPKFKKEWIVNACNLITHELLQNEICSRKIFQEIFELFRNAMKKAMLDYILRSPEERKRLHITLLPRPFMHSAQRIGREGGFNMRLFPDWHDFVENGKEYCRDNLILINPINSALQDWIQDFQNCRLCDLHKVKLVSKLGCTFTLPEFQRVQTIYKLNIICLLEHIWYRGAISLVKLGKYLRQKNLQTLWTVTGPKILSRKQQQQQQQQQSQFSVVQEESEDEEQDENLIYYGENYPTFISVNKAAEFYRNRMRLPYFGGFKDSCQTLSAYYEYYLKLYNKRPQDPAKVSQYALEELKSREKPYKMLEKEGRKKIIQNVTIQIQLQLRQIIERSLDHLEQNLLSIDLNKSYPIITEDCTFQNLQTAWTIMKDRQFQLPQWELLNQEYSPFIRLHLCLENEQIHIKENYEIVKNEMIDIVRSIIVSFDKFLNPKFAKVRITKLEEQSNNLLRDIQFNFDADMGGMTKEDFQKFFKSFWPNVRIEEKQQKEHPELLLASEEQKTSLHERKCLQVASIQEQEYVNIENRIVEHVLNHFNNCQQIIEYFKQFQCFIDKSTEKEIKAFIQRKTITNEEFKQYMEILSKYLKLLDQFPNNVEFPIFQINCELVIKGLKQAITEYKDKIFNKFESILIDTARILSDRYIQISTFIRKSLKTPEDVEIMDKYISDVQQERTTIKTKSVDIFIKVMFLLKQDYTISENLLQLSEELHHRPNQLDKELMEQEEKHAVERQRLEDELRKQRSLFEDRVLIYCEDIHNFETFTEKNKYKSYISEIEEFEDKLYIAEKEMQDIVSKEQTLFGFKSNFENFLILQKDILPYSELWKSVGLFMENKKKWQKGPICEVDSSDVETIIKAQLKCTQKLTRIFKPNSIPYRVSTEYKEEILQMNTHVQTIEVLSNPGLRERHWNSINVLLGQNFIPSEVCLNDLLVGKAKENIKEIEEISENASKEYQLENALKKMVEEWDKQKLVVINFKNRGVLILQGSSVEEIQTLLDDHAIKAQTIRANPSIKFMEEQAIRWEKLMLFIQEILDLWVKVQGMYLYLEPIFSFEDISKTLFEESEKFKTVNSHWTTITRAVEEDPLALHLELIPNLLDTLKTCLRLIEEIQKGLENHLEIKRLEFPRFFFLSNDDLINILAETRDPLLVQPHMRKCFEGIEELIFNSNSDILGMKSVEKEEVHFDTKVNPKEFKNYVEKWLLRVEDEMKITLGHLIRQCFSDIRDLCNLKKWVQRWPGQCILTCACLHFTFQVENTLEQGRTLNKFGNDRLEYLNEIVNMVRLSETNNERQLLSALIVLDVHNNDILNELIRLEMRDTSLFEWTSQLRYYMDENAQFVITKMVYTTIEYGYEYLGIGSRLVITPLTDRCYRTLVGALQLNLGGAPEGPAGTGKTESVKDLAKAVAVQCIVFNCGEGLNTHAMAKFFKGLTSSGAWSCFDEFNRIDLEVLSVIAQQILQIQQAKSLFKTKFLFEGTDIALQQSCNIFITMNPGYAGRSELPDNLKALFRPCAMMVPDYALIAEISLYSYGFVDARQLAKKIVAVYKLCSEQLSSQDHYDYGMRAVKAVLTASQSLKRRNPTQAEDILIFRAIGDINLPKFLTQDVMLFNGIMSDLFPEVKPPNIEYKALNEAMNNVLMDNKMQIVQNFKRKVLQLYETINCRHGLMIVGQTMSGKTSCYQVLAQTLSYCNKNGTQEEQSVQYHILNPKSITLNQLYGYSDPVSKEWTEGVLGEIYRKCATSQSADRQFIVFDGPVDAGWIENMNTVLDDNKKLCLMSGETIPMSDKMSILFEVQDLTQASPATVSRCGMVYMQPEQLGWVNIFQKELNLLQLDNMIAQRILDLFEAIVDKCQKFVKLKCHEYEQVPENSFNIHLLKQLVHHIEDYQQWKQDESTIKLDGYFLYCLVWTVGGSIDELGRKHFDQYLKKLIKEPLRVESKKDVIVKIDRQSLFPEISNTQVYDYYFHDCKWHNWKDKLSDSLIPYDSSFQEILVETQESLRVTALIKSNLTNHSPLLIVGPSGVGKTCFIRKHLTTLQQYLLIYVNFSATTSSQLSQHIIDSKLDRRRKGVFGPQLGINGLIYIDDLNMPAPDKYGTQAPLELFRQFLDCKGWFGLDRQFMHIIDVNIVASMGLSGGGRSKLSQRLVRHFHLVSIVQPENSIIVHIFKSIIEWHLSKVCPGIDQDSRKTFEYAIEATVDLYNQIREQLKPTPRKSWYFMNLRDISRVVQGMTLASSMKELQGDNKKIQRLWLHETTRTFYDRLAEEDHEAYQLMLANSIKYKLKDDMKHMIKPYDDQASQKFNKLTNYIWSDILSEEISPADRQYTEIYSIARVYSKLQFYLDELNSNTKKPLNLALFDYALDHIIRIQRALVMIQGHLLLIGLGGSGRQSLTRLACYIREQEFLQIEVSKNYTHEQWFEDMQKLMITTGTENKETTFVISDSHIRKPFILEDVNNLLNSGDIPNVFAMEDFIPLIDKLRIKAKKDGKTQLLDSGTNAQFYDYFIECVKRKLHVVLAMSPIGDTLRSRIRMFPSIVNCTTIDCFHQWPEEALEAVARKYLSDMSIENTAQSNLVAQCKFMHESLIEQSTLYLSTQGRHMYVTPSSYFELLRTFQAILNVEKPKIENTRNMYRNGVIKLNQTAEEVKRMEQQLIEKQPMLIEMSKEATHLASVIRTQAEAMEPKKIQAQEEEQRVSECVKEAEIINAECEKDLAVAKPKLKQAEDALNTLSANDINSIKAMLKPPETVQLVMESVCVLCGVPAMIIPNPNNPKERIPSFWEASKKFLAEKDFLQRLIKYDKNSINPQIMQRVRDKYISNTQSYNPKRVEKASSAAKGLCEWVLALNEYEKVLRVVRPKQEKYIQSQQEVERLQASLKKTQEELSELLSEIQRLKETYEETIQKVKDLENDIKECELKLGRATKLMEGLGGEGERWQVSAEIFDARVKQVLGDMLLSSGVIAYLGIFSNEYRIKTIQLWTDRLKQNKSLGFNENFSLLQILGEAIQIRQWRINGLPSDQFSIENGIIMNRCQRYPLFIDPQGQANKFIKNNENFDEKMNVKLRVAKLNDLDFLRSLDNAIQFGQTLLIENVGEELDSSLDSILQKQIFKNAGVQSIRIGENVVPFNKHFNLFFTTKLSNPHYTPEIAAKVTLINFTITQNGLEDQLLEICVMKEQPNLEEEKNKQIIQQYKNKQELQKIEDQILRVLNKAENILNDEEAIEILQDSKEKSKDIEEKQRTSEYTEKKIDEARIQYKPIAYNAALLFFAVIHLSNLEQIYQYSLNWLLNLYLESFVKAEQSQKISLRIHNLNTTLLNLIYTQVCRGLFEKDKLLFSFMILVKTLEQKKSIDFNELSFVVRPLLLPQSVPENIFNWIPKQTWSRIQQLTKLSKKMAQITDSFSANNNQWIELLNDQDGHSVRLPEPFHNITQLQRLCILKAMRPGKLPQAMSDFVAQELGEKYIQPPPFSLSLSFQSSNCKQPILFILPGTDPMNSLMSFADSKGIALRSVSLGQGQGVIAEKEIEDAKVNGNWVILQNCHLAPSWMGKLEKICEDLSSTKINSQFRLWLTSYPSPDLPSSVIQSAIKITNEPPNGIKSNLMVSYQSSLIQEMNLSKQTPKLNKLLYSMCFFHAVIQERRNYGSIGFNIYYDFNQSDLLISIRQLQQLIEINKNTNLPFHALHYLVGECNYGGKVTDERDRRILKALLNEYVVEQTMLEDFRFCGLQDYKIPIQIGYDEYLQSIQNLPQGQPSQLFGFHPNAEIMKQQKYSDELTLNLQITMGTSYFESAASDQKPDHLLRQLCDQYLTAFPKKFDTEIAQAKYPHDPKNSYNTVFLQEIIRYNRLIQIIHQSFIEVDAALKGLVAMSEQLEKITQSLLNGQVPDSWKKFSYPSLKPLGSYLQDFFRRIHYFQNWLDKNPPYIHWISGFFFTQSFLTAVLQNHARKYLIAIDKLIFDFQFLEEPTENYENNQSPRAVDDGILIFGLFLEGCKWDYNREQIAESDPKVLTTMAPIIWLKPIQQQEQIDDLKDKVYKCPVYKTAERKGVLSTTGHSTNFIMNVNYPSTQNQYHWVKRGVAMLCQLSD